MTPNTTLPVPLPEQAIRDIANGLNGVHPLLGQWERDLRLARAVERARMAPLQERADALQAELELVTHKVITCGVAATHPDRALTTHGAYKEKWDSPQAEDVRTLRARADALEAALRRLVLAISNQRKGPSTKLNITDWQQAGDALDHEMESAFDRASSLINPTGGES